MRKILIFENQKNDVENTFKYINLVHYKNELDITYFVSSQELAELSNIQNYELIVIDIDLARNSKKDGIGIINDIKKEHPEYLKKIFVITGSPGVRDRLNEEGFSNIPVILKPTNNKEVYAEMKKILR